ncbi:MAG: DUF3149 domain-containing protein [Betaproteobacteria bacterium]|nr:DUF3149 domain-containing protein [Betaproteobacteria bacterium]
MELLSGLFADKIGLLSVFTIGFCIVMAIYLWVYVSKKMDEEPSDKG